MTLIDFLFPKIRTLKTWSGKCLKSPVSEDPSKRNMVNVPDHCRNLHQSIFIIFIDHWQVKLVGKSFFFSIFQVLGRLVNTLTAEEKYPVLNRDNLTIPIQMQLSQKQKFFINFLIHFLNLD